MINEAVLLTLSIGINKILAALEIYFRLHAYLSYKTATFAHF